jgi:HEAT repeat protein
MAYYRVITLVVFLSLTSCASQKQSHQNRILDLNKQLRSNDPAPRQAALDELETMGEAAADPLIGALSNNDPKVRARAAELLGKIKAGRATDSLIAGLSDANPDVRIKCAWALGQIKDPRAIGPLISAFTSVEEELKRLRDFRGYGFLPGARSELYGPFRDQVGEALAKTEDRRVVAFFLTQPEAFFTRHVVNQMGDAAVAHLIALLGDEDWQTRVRAARALKEFRSPAAVEPLNARLTDPSIHVRVESAGALGEVGDERAMEPLVEAIRQEMLCDHAARALKMINESRAVDMLTPILKDERWEVRMNAVMALRVINSRRAVNPLMSALDDDNTKVRRAAASALRSINGED